MAKFIKGACISHYAAVVYSFLVIPMRAPIDCPKCSNTLNVSIDTSLRKAFSSSVTPLKG